MDLISIDNNLFIILSQNYKTPLLTFIAFLFSGVGILGLIWIVAAILLIAKERKQPKIIFLFFLTILTANVLTSGFFKPIFERLRPQYSLPGITVYEITHDFYSFPSAHAATALAGAVILAHIFPKRKTLIYMLAFLISVSRVYLAVHFPLDIIAGGIVGYSIGLLFLYINKKMHFSKIR